MTTIGPLGQAAPALPTRRAMAARGGGFSVPADPDATTAPIDTASGAPATAALGSMLALQESGIEPAEDRAARRRARDLLAALAELQRALLGGEGAADALGRLAELADSVPEAADPRLAALLAAIKLRAWVELARRAGPSD